MPGQVNCGKHSPEGSQSPGYDLAAHDITALEV